MKCQNRPGCAAPADSGHWCPASPEQVRRLGYVVEPDRDRTRTVSPFVRRALAAELPAKEYGR